MSFLKCLTLIVCAAAASQTALAQNDHLKSIVRIEVRASTTKGAFVRMGSGFLVGRSDFVLTARHVVVPDAELVKDDVTGLERRTISVVVRDSNGLMRDRRTAFIYQEAVAADAVLLALDAKTDNPALQTCPDLELSGPLEVTAHGFPAHIVGSGDESDGETLDSAGGKLAERRAGDIGRYRFGATTRHGLSGAPVFIEGQVVGMLTGGTDGRLNAANYSMFSPLSLLRHKVLSACSAPCESPAHGVDQYRNSITWTAESNPLDQQEDPIKYCQALIDQRRTMASGKEIDVSEMHERVDVDREGRRKYKYSCVFLEQWHPKFKKIYSKHCESPLNTDALPR